MLLRTSFEGSLVRYATTIDGLAERSGVGPCILVPDCNRSDPKANLLCLVAVCRLVWGFRPDVIVSTGAAPGLLALLVGKLIGARTIWIDSVANSEKLSMSGTLAGWFVDLWLTQWRHLARERGPQYFGSVL